jgi:hypothetical protein
MSALELQTHFYSRITARVLGCLNRGLITVILCPGHGIVLIEPIPVDWVPIDLRIPNSEFDILIEFPGGKRIRVLRKDEVFLEIEC